MRKKPLQPRSETDWAALDAMRDEEIDFPEIPEADEHFFKTATLRLPQPKASVCLRVDREVLEWFKAQGKGYQTRMNAVLKAYKEAHQDT
ncbi:MAG: BrnA antitoxin family protein [Deltaproteobacteria bacterium]|nr:BrnA antitoxin family protein [Deltaproteobacteria bacterium]